MTFLLFFWIGFSIVVGVAANARGRDGVGWFLLSLVISPVIALLLVLVMERKNTGAVGSGTAPSAVFEPDAVHVGIPYRMQPDGSVEAVMHGARVRFLDQEKFAAAAGTPLPEKLSPPPAPRGAQSFSGRDWVTMAVVLFVLWAIFGSH